MCQPTVLLLLLLLRIAGGKVGRIPVDWIAGLYTADMTSSVSRTRGTRHWIAIAPRMLLTLLMPLLIRPTSAQSPQQQKYVISVGTPSNKLVSGTLWLYSYSWYGLQQYKLAAIKMAWPWCRSTSVA